MTQTLVEKVADAIVGARFWRDEVSAARAAIAVVLREMITPTEAMCEAGSDRVQGHCGFGKIEAGLALRTMCKTFAAENGIDLTQTGEKS